MLMANSRRVNFFFIIIYSISLIISIFFLIKFLYSKNNFYIILVLITLFINLLIFLIHRSNFIVLKINFLIFLYLFVISIYLIEGFIGIKKYNFNKTLITSILSENIQDYEIVPSINSKKEYKIHDTFLPLGLIPNYKTKLCNEEGYWAKYISDNYGFRNENKEIWSISRLDILFLGDSFSIGNCVNKKDEMSYLLGKKSKMNVINLGIQGTGPLRQYATFLEYGKEKKPNKIIWFFYEGNDLMDLATELKSPILLKYLKDHNYSQDLKNREVEIINFYKKYSNSKKTNLKNTINIKIYFKKFLKLFEIRSIINSNYNIKLSTKKNDKNNLKLYSKFSKDYKNILLNLKSVSQSWSGEIIFVYLPSLKLFNNTKYYQENNIIKTDIINFLKKENFKVIDVFKIFNTYEKPSNFFNQRKNLHYGKEAYSLIVDEINNNLKFDN
jgi:hypothetical protein